MMLDKNGQKIHLKEAEYQEFARFMAMPRKERIEVYGYDTQGAYAKAYQTTDTVLSLWKREPEFWQKVEEFRKAWFKERTPEVLLALYRTILKKGQANEVSLWLKYIEEWVESRKTQVEGNLDTTTHFEPGEEVENAVKEFIKWRKENSK